MTRAKVVKYKVSKKDKERMLVFMKTNKLPRKIKVRK